MTDAEALDIYKLVRRITSATGVHDHHDHEDVTQQAMLRVLQSCETTPPRGGLRSCIVWRAVRDARNVLFGAPTFAKGIRALRAATCPLTDTHRAEESQRPIIEDEVRHVARKLTARERAMILWRADGLSYGEIGQRVGLRGMESRRPIVRAQTIARFSQKEACFRELRGVG